MDNEKLSKEEISQFLQKLLNMQKELQELKLYTYRTINKMAGRAVYV